MTHDVYEGHHFPKPLILIYRYTETLVCFFMIIRYGTCIVSRKEHEEHGEQEVPQYNCRTVCTRSPQCIRHVNPYDFFVVFAGKMSMVFFPNNKVFQSVPKYDGKHRGFPKPPSTCDVVGPY